MAVLPRVIGLLILSNLFMTYAWYGHLKNLADRPFFYMGTPLKLQEVITLSVFVPFAFFYMGTPLKLDYLWAALCLLGAVFFIFRS